MSVPELRFIFSYLRNGRYRCPGEGVRSYLNMDAPPQASPGIVTAAWQELGRHAEIVELTNISANVSTNQVYRVALSDGHELIAKTSTYGSYVHFRQDHKLIDRWSQLLQDTRFSTFLARMVLKGESVFTYGQDNVWIVFYEKAQFYDFLPRILDDAQIDALGREMAEFHEASTRASKHMDPSWKTIGSDVAGLYDALGSHEWREQRQLDSATGEQLRRHCDLVLENAERLGYHSFAKIPVLVDWNIGNFSVGFDQNGFKFYSRWDYDWFRIGSRMMDFYFCARVVRAEGDKTIFTYHTEPFFEPRFRRFLRAYHARFPLTESEVLFLKEAYRFFLLNYVVRSGEHFFRPTYCERLQREVVHTYLPALDAIDFSPLLDILD